MKLFTLKLNKKKGQCDAMRCKSPTSVKDFPGELWGTTQAALCKDHVAQAIAFAEANPDYEPPQAAVVLHEDAVLIAELQIKAAEAKEMMELAPKCRFETQEDLVTINELLRDVKSELKTLEAQEKDITGPMTTALNRVRALFRPAKQYWKDAEVALKRIIANAKTLQAVHNQKAIEEASRALDRGDVDGHLAALNKVHTVSDLEGTSVTTQWAFEIEDETLLLTEGPMEARQPNLTWLREHCAHSTAHTPEPVPGVRFYPDASVRTTASEPAE